jgi:hypothetical protein
MYLVFANSIIIAICSNYTTANYFKELHSNEFETTIQKNDNFHVDHVRVLNNLADENYFALFGKSTQYNKTAGILKRALNATFENDTNEKLLNFLEIMSYTEQRHENY